MPTPFDDLTVARVTDALRALALTPAHAAARAYVAGDHWQGGAGWIGPQPSSSDRGYAETMREIQRAFLAKGALAEVVGRHRSGVVGRAPHWTLTVRRPLADGEAPTAEEQARIDEATAALTVWWDARGISSILLQALITLLCTARVPVRLFVPPGLLDETNRLPAGDLLTQLVRVRPDLPAPDAAGIVADTATATEASALLYRDGTTAKAEVSLLDGESTVLRILSGDGIEAETRLPLNGNLLLTVVTRDAPLITEPIIGQQRLLNLAYTMLGRNVVVAGFVERVLLNAQLPGTFERDPTTGQTRFVPQPLRFGAGSVNALVGAEIRDTDGTLKGLATPSVIYRDPVAVDTFRDTRDLAYRAILEEVQQLHALLSGDAVVSGESRIQALADYAASLLLTAPAVESLIRWLLETALALAAHFAGMPNRFADLRATVSVRLDLGPLTAAEAAMLISLVDAKLLSRETARGRIPWINDVDAEGARVQTESEASATVMSTALAAFNSGQ